MYRVVKYFTDLTDNNHAYNTGDKFPRDGMVVGESRITELSTNNNKLGIPVIEFVEDEPEVVDTVADNEDDKADEKYTAEILQDMTTREIKTLAAERGYKITKNSKYDVIAQFLKQQR